MKKIYILLALFTTFPLITHAQLNGEYSTEWSIFVFDEEDIQAYAGNDVQADVSYKDLAGNVIYSESHAGSLDENSFISFMIGSGTNPQPFPLNKQLYNQIETFSWFLTVQSGDGPKVVSGEEAVKPGIWSTHATLSMDSEGLGGNTYNAQSKTFMEVFNPNPDPVWSILMQRNSDEPPAKTISTLPLQQFIQFGKSIASVTEEEVDVVRLGKNHRGGYEENCYHVFGPSFAEVIDALYFMCVPFLDRVQHLVTLKIDDREHIPGMAPRTATHTTGVLFAENKSPDLSAGVIATAGTWGVFANGANGVVGNTVGTSNGAAVWGAVQSPPATGGFKYGMFSNAGGHANAYSAYFIGTPLTTVAWQVASDARFKTEIRAHENALDKVMQLRPASYLYRQDNPYHFPEGLHHGFIAQEMETIFPELVKDVPMPKDLDPLKMYKSEAIEYKTINYTELISVLTSAIQELNTALNAKIEEQAAEIQELRQLIEASKGK